jgi:hypothetical protein
MLANSVSESVTSSPAKRSVSFSRFNPSKRAVSLTLMSFLGPFLGGYALNAGNEGRDQSVHCIPFTADSPLLNIGATLHGVVPIGRENRIGGRVAVAVLAAFCAEFCAKKECPVGVFAFLGLGPG